MSLIYSQLKKGAVSFCCAISLSACTTLGPEYEEPKVEWLDKWQPDLYGQYESVEKAQEVDLRFWWKTFNDPVLDKLIHISAERNINLRIAGLRVLESRAVLGIAGSAEYPQVQQLSSGVTAAQTRRRGGALPNKDDSLVSYNAGFNLGWELDFWGKFQRGIESADSSFFNSIANHQNMQVLINSQVADLYFSYRTLEKRIEIARENARLQKRSYQITEKIYLEGQDSELDLQQAKSQYLATLTTIPKLQISLTKTRNALATILARPPGDIPEIIQDKRSLPSMDRVSLRDMPVDLLMRRPDIRGAAWLVAAQSAQIGIAEADFYPSISLLGSISWSGNTVSSAPDNGFLGAGPGLTWNLFDHGRIANNVRVQDARLQQLIEQYQNTVLTAAREIDDSAIGVIKTMEQKEIFVEAVKAAQRALVIANRRYREGYSDFQRVLDAQRALFTQEEQELVNQGNHIASIIGLYKALGGGWTEEPVEKLISEDLKQTMEARTDWGDLLKTELPENSSQPPITRTGTTPND